MKYSYLINIKKFIKYLIKYDLIENSGKNLIHGQKN